jgi:signal transduction histidine kinase
MAERGEKPVPKVVATVSRQIVAQVDRAAGIINHLREFGRKSDLDELETVNVNKPIRDVFTLLGQQLKLKQIEVKLDLQEDLPAIRGVSNRLEQVFINLVMNSRDAMEEKRGSAYQVDETSVLRIRSFAEEGRVVVSIADTGIGMPEHVKERIFEPFFTTKEVGKGTGLGLSISYGIVKDYGGTIEMESEVGRGTTFTLTFPALAGGVERVEEHLA